MERLLTDIKRDLSFIRSNKLNSGQSLIMFIGLTAEIIKRRDLFYRNSELKNFIEKFYIPKTKEKKPLGDYLYDSRPLLIARITNLILQDFDYTKVLKTCEQIEEIIPGEINRRSNKFNLSNYDLAVSEWMNFISSK